MRKHLWQQTPTIYTVDFTASSGNQNISAAGYGGREVVYPDRAAEDKKLLVYTKGAYE
jgi:hypothetical protein